MQKYFKVKYKYCNSEVELSFADSHWGISEYYSVELHELIVLLISALGEKNS